MSHLDEVIERVDAALDESVITHMNDTALSREDRFTQQQRLRVAIAHHGKNQQELEEARRELLSQGGVIL